MVKHVQRLGHATAAANLYRGLVREITVDIDDNSLRVHDGTTLGGHAIKNQAYNDNAYIRRAETSFLIDTISEKSLDAGVTLEGVLFEDATLDNVNTINGVDFDDFVGDYAAHVANVSNPHAVTKTQVGLANVTNDAQLTIASNLSDVANAATAFANIKQAATESATGAAEISTQGEFEAFTDDVRYITPLKLGRIIKTGANLTAAQNIGKPSVANQGGRYYVNGDTEIETLWSTDGIDYPVTLIFGGSPNLVHSSALILPGGTDYQVSPGDMAICFPEDADAWRLFILREDGSAVTTPFGYVAVGVETTATIAQNGTLFRFTTAGVPFNLPAVAGNAGLRYTILNDAASGNITINPDGTELLDGLSTRALRPGDETEIMCTGSSWITVRGVYSFESVPQTIALNTHYKLAHGLGVKPTGIRWIFRCHTATGGKQVGDEVDLNTIQATYIGNILTNTTHTSFRHQQTYYYVTHDPDGGAIIDLSPTYFNLVAKAEWRR